MKGYERNYDFGDLLDCASGLNRLAAFEYGEEAVKVSKGHVKQRTLWAKLHPLPPDQTKPDLADFGGLETDEKIYSALQTDEVPSGMDIDVDETNDLEVYGHEARHAMSETLSGLLMEDQPMKKKVDPMVSYEGHQMYKASLVNGLISSRSCRGRQGQKQRRDGQAKQVWFGRVQKIRRKYNGKWAKSRSEIDLLDRPVAQAGEGCCCQVLFNWYNPVAGSKIKFMYDNTDLQWIDLESVITVVSMKMERTIRVLWTLDNNDRARINEFIAGL
ncbi:hypothetical protein R1sor_019366 [Riccia sorocarpa]|uniref:Uncharacterized protein n=1 Tax=Riccia sorocarpa TaxID=122646 RepID=A0ABD3III3_9MARC